MSSWKGDDPGGRTAMIDSAAGGKDGEWAVLRLPPPRRDGSVSVESALARRRSLREFAATPLSLAEMGQLLWAGQGITGSMGRRAAPSAGSTYPLETYVAAAAVDGLPAGVHRYLPVEHALEPLTDGDPRRATAAAALDQDQVRTCAAAILLAGVPSRISERYGERGARYLCLEAGHAAQNVLLQAVALGLGGVVTGAFDDHAIAGVMGLRRAEEPLYLIALGRPPA
jgi:SagB-type dehydrogenase family enzyme